MQKTIHNWVNDFVKHTERLSRYGEKFSSSGGLLKSDSASSEPSNPKQVYNARSSTSNLRRNIDKDEIFQVLTHASKG